MAIECIRKEIQRIAFDANMVQFGPSVAPGAKKAAERKKKLEQAIEVLESGYNKNA